jgi:hypothetical protein
METEDNISRKFEQVSTPTLLAALILAISSGCAAKVQGLLSEMVAPDLSQAQVCNNGDRWHDRDEMADSARQALIEKYFNSIGGSFTNYVSLNGEGYYLVKFNNEYKVYRVFEYDFKNRSNLQQGKQCVQVAPRRGNTADQVKELNARGDAVALFKQIKRDADRIYRERSQQMDEEFNSAVERMDEDFNRRIEEMGL